MYNDSVNGGMFNGRDLEELPEAVGPVVQLQEKLYVPVKEYPDVSGRGGDLSPFRRVSVYLLSLYLHHRRSSLSRRLPPPELTPADVIRT